MFHSILRIPRMCEQFQKSLLRKQTHAGYMKAQKEAINFMKDHVDESNQNEFFDKYAAHLAQERPPVTDVFSDSDEPINVLVSKPISKKKPSSQTIKRRIAQHRRSPILSSSSPSDEDEYMSPKGLVEIPSSVESLETSPKNQNLISFENSLTRLPYGRLTEREVKHAATQPASPTSSSPVRVYRRPLKKIYPSN